MFALTTIALIIADVFFVPPQGRFHFVGWVELSLAALFTSVGVNRNGENRGGGALYIGVGVFLLLVVLIGFVFVPSHAHS